MNENILLLSFLGMSICFWKWLLASLGAFILGWLLHWWLFSKGLKEQIVSLTKERDDYHGKFTTMEKDYIGLKYKYEELEKEYNTSKSALRLCEADKSILTNKLETATAGIVAGAVLPSSDKKSGDVDFGALLGSGNLQIVEGIGPKIDGLLKAGGIQNWSDLAAASYDKLKEILAAAGSRYGMHDPKTWPKQAGLAADGKWDELIQFQKFTDGGRDDSGSFETPAKVEKLLAKKLGFSSTNPDDLKVVEGIGPKIEELLKAAGINNWTALATATEEQLQAVLNEAGSRYKLADPSSWAQQANLAAESKWGELKNLQNFLDGGKAPK